MIDRESTSFNDVGLFIAYQDLSYELNNKFGIQIPPEEIEPYIKNGTIKVGGRLRSIRSEIDAVFQAAAEKIVSRVKNTWRNMWEIKILITGGGSVILGEYLCQAFSDVQVEICEEATFTNCIGFYSYGRKIWQWSSLPL